jgi:hypothetical protein
MFAYAGARAWGSTGYNEFTLIAGVFPIRNALDP